MKRARLVYAVAVLFCTSGVLRGQTATGQITGTVRDSTGAVVTGAKVTVSNQLTGLNREATTSDTGDYVVPVLPVGLYSVTTESRVFGRPSVPTFG